MAQSRRPQPALDGLDDIEQALRALGMHRISPRPQAAWAFAWDADGLIELEGDRGAAGRALDPEVPQSLKSRIARCSIVTTESPDVPQRDQWNSGPEQFRVLFPLDKPARSRVTWTRCVRKLRRQ
jgi:hypothetical protein